MGWVFIANTTTKCVYDSGTRIAEDPNTGRLWISLQGYRDYEGRLENAYAAYSDDGGETWTVETIYEYPFEEAGLPPNLVVESDSDVWAVWTFSPADGSCDIVYSVRNHATGNWSAPAIIFDGSITHDYSWVGYQSPPLALDSLGHKHIIWETWNTVDDTYRLWYSEYAVNWSVPVVILSQPYPDSITAQAIAIDSPGHVYALFMYDSGSWNDLGYMVKTGVNWGAVQRVGTDTWIPNYSWSNQMTMDSDGDVHIGFWAYGAGHHPRILYRAEISGSLQSIEVVDTIDDLAGGHWFNHCHIGMSYSLDGKIHMVVGYEDYYDSTNRHVIHYRRSPGGVWVKEDLGAPSGGVVCDWAVSSFGAIHPSANFLGSGFRTTGIPPWGEGFGAYFYIPGGKSQAHIIN